MRISGSCTSVAASRMRWRMPREYVSMGRCCASARSTSAMARSTAALEILDAAELPHHPHELAALHESVDGLVLRHHADAPYSGGLSRTGWPNTVTVPLDVVGEAGHHAEQRGLAGAVRPEQAGDAGHDVERHVAHGHDAPEPAGYAVDPDHARIRRRGPLSSRIPRSGLGVAQCEAHGDNLR